VTYTYGLARLAQVEDGDVAWFLGDALGSVRQVVDDDGAVILARDYGPYGRVTAESGTGRSGYGFTGEQTDATTGLVFLRARWLDPATGRFLSVDPWQGSARQPASLHGYLYVAANPVNRVDPSGHFGISVWEPRTQGDNPRDLTDWLYRELSQNVGDPVVVKLRNMNRAGRGMMILGPCAGVPGALVRGSTLLTFRNQVKNGARWDFKDEIGLNLGPGITLCASNACFDDIEFSVPGNIFFAYIGRAAGFSGVELQQGAAWAEFWDPAHKEGHREYVGPYEGTFPIPVPGPTWWDPSTWNWGDEPKDHEAVTLGIQLWNKYRDTMTRSQLEGEVASHVSVLDRHKPSLDPVTEDIARDWPYPVGYFDNRGVPYTGEER